MLFLNLENNPDADYQRVTYFAENRVYENKYPLLDSIARKSRSQKSKCHAMYQNSRKMSDILFVVVEYLLKPPFKFFVAFNPTVEDGAVGCKEKYAKVNFRNRNDCQNTGAGSR